MSVFHPLRLIAFIVAMLAAIAPATASLPPADPLLRDSPHTTARLSPTGEYVAVRFAAGDGVQRLAVVDLESGNVKKVAHFSNAEIRRFVWLSDERLVFDVHQQSKGSTEDDPQPGIWAVNRDGSDFRQLTARHWTPERLPSNMVMATTHSGSTPDTVFAYAYLPRFKGSSLVDVELWRINTITGRGTQVPWVENVTWYMTDTRGEPRLVNSVGPTSESVHYRDPATDTWKPLASTAIGEHDQLQPIGFAPDGSLYVGARAGGDKRALYRYDLTNGKLAPVPLLKLEHYDFEGALVSSNKLLGVRYLTDGEATVWFDKDMKALQARIDQLLPDTVNRIEPAQRPKAPWVLVASFSDRQPVQYRVFNTRTGLINLVGQAHPNVDAARMARTKMVHYSARDGLTIPAWLTLPTGSEGRKVPLVVRVHDGPFKRGRSWGWDGVTQFLASRGYAVLEPEYRGSSGFGKAHASAGLKQWGLKMQDDLADGVQWAVAQGLVEPGQVCIAGDGYGGYAALMGVIRDPNVFRCAAARGAPTDLRTLNAARWKHISKAEEQYTEARLASGLGDQERDASQLAATSPAAQVAKLGRPVLLAYGTEDWSIPIAEARTFRDAALRTGSPVEWIEYNGTDDALQEPDNRLDYWLRAERFIKRHIGNP